MASAIAALIKVLIVDDNDFIRLGIKTALGSVRSISVIGESSNGLEAVHAYGALLPDVVLMDLNMPQMNGVEATRAIKQINPAAKVIILTSNEEEREIYNSLSAGANGYCLKDVDLARLQEAICAVHYGDLWLDSSIAGKVVKLCSSQMRPQDQATTTQFGTLTDIEREIMNLLVVGCTTSDIALRLHLPVSTAKAYVINVLNKVTAVTELAQGDKAEAIEPETLNFARDSTLIEKYELVSRLGSGGMSVVFKAKHRLLSRMVAVKFLNNDSFRQPHLQRRFLLEAQITSSLSHPSIITVYDFGINQDGQPYLVMDYVDGPTLAQVLERGGPIPEREAVRLFSQVSSALAFAHSRGVVHRDVKPGNVILSFPPGEAACAKVLDFGLAQSDSNNDLDHQRLTQHGCALGSPLYMSPEACQGKQVDARSDMYSFGCLMYEVLKGVPPFRGESAFDTMNLHVHHRPPQLDSLQSPQLRDLIGRCLAKTPEERFSSAQEITNELNLVVA